PVRLPGQLGIHMCTLMQVDNEPERDRTGLGCASPGKPVQAAGMTESGPAAIPASSRKRHALRLFSGLPSGYDRMGALLSFGQDPRWRRALVAGMEPGPEQRILDVATGTGMVAAELVRRGAG